MKLSVRMFAAARDAVGRESVEIELPEGATVADLRAALSSEHRALVPLLRHSLFACDSEYAGEETSLRPDTEIACIPPVSGG